MERLNVIISTDGSCKGNPGPGGYGAVLRFGEHSKEISGFDPQTTNNRMELTAVIEAVKLLKKPCNVIIRTDSMFVCNGIANAKERSLNGWRTKTGARCANTDLWQELHNLGVKGKHHFQYLWVKGHTGDKDNERCDILAKEQVLTNTEA